MHRWLIDQDSSVSSEMPDGQGLWHYDDEVNICSTYIWLFLFLYMCFYCVFMTILYVSLKVCVTIVTLLLLVIFILSLLFLLCVTYGIVVLVPLTFKCCAVS